MASEVRNLASRSAQAAKEIETLLNESVSNINTGSDQVKKAGEAMSKILRAVQQVNDIMGEIASASGEQSKGISQVGIAVKEMDSVTQQNVHLVQQSVLSSADLEKQAVRLNEVLALFRIAQSAQTKAVPTVVKTASVTPSIRSPLAAEENWETF